MTYSLGAPLRKRNIKKTASALARRRAKKNTEAQGPGVSAHCTPKSILATDIGVAIAADELRRKEVDALRSFMGVPGNG